MVRPIVPREDRKPERYGGQGGEAEGEGAGEVEQPARVLGGEH